MHTFSHQNIQSKQIAVSYLFSIVRCRFFTVIGVHNILSFSEVQCRYYLLSLIHADVAVACCIRGRQPCPLPSPNLFFFFGGKNPKIPNLPKPTPDYFSLPPLWSLFSYQAQFLKEKIYFLFFSGTYQLKLIVQMSYQYCEFI